jgi:Cu(I)/Ag(I) efflux system membrane protein CusA/SilA
MTVCAILFGLLPILWSPVMQAGADVMKRIATPMVGGVLTSGILELLIYPVIFVIWKKRSLPQPRQVASLQIASAPQEG